jgi:hypothetical protein
MSGDGGTLESLHDVSQHLLDKLEGVGIQYVSDLATKTVSELLEEYYSNYEDANMGLDIPKEHIELMLGHYPGLDRRIMCLYGFLFCGMGYKLQHVV